MKGHLRQRGNPPHGPWYAVIDDRDHATGKRLRRWINLGTTRKRDAQDALAKLLTAKQEGTLPAPGKVTVTDVLRAYVESRRVAGLAPSTILRYESLIRDRIAPRLGAIPVADLRPDHLERHYAAELKAPRSVRKPKEAPADWSAGTLAPRTVQFEHQILHAALKRAVKQDLIPRNPADAVTPPQPAKKEQAALSPEQAAALLDALTGHRLYALYFLALSTGMRKGELIGLRWVDVDLDAARLSVRVQLQYLPGQGTHERVTKEHRGERPLELTPEEVDVLRRHRAAQAEERLRLGALWRDHGLVFPSEAGTPLSPRNLSRLHKATLVKAGLPNIRFHDLRHTAGTLIMREDGRVVVAQRRLGHAKASTTMDMYGHALPGDQRAATGKVLDTIRKARQAKPEAKW